MGYAASPALWLEFPVQADRSCILLIRSMNYFPVQTRVGEAALNLISLFFLSANPCPKFPGWTSPLTCPERLLVLPAPALLAWVWLAYKDSGVLTIPSAHMELGDTLYSGWGHIAVPLPGSQSKLLPNFSQMGIPLREGLGATFNLG